MDHTASDIVVVDDASMLPLGRPTITSALDEHTRCPMGFYAGFEPPSCLAVMRCLQHAILPKTSVPREFPSVKNCWECYGVPELVVVDNPPEFHSSHFERACLQIGTDIQYTKVLVPWYKGKLERFQGTLNHGLMHGNPGTTFSNILERDDYDPSRHAVVLLSTFREMLHKWIIDVYLQTPHRGIQDTPAHRWHTGMNGLPPPLPRSASELQVVLGMTAQRAVFHNGVELEGLKYNGPELGELRRRMGPGVKVELTFDPGDLGHIHVFDPLKETYIRVPAMDQAYATRLSLWQHKVIRRYAQRLLQARTDMVALAQAKAEIRALVERDFNRKSTRGRKRRARFMEDHSSARLPEREARQPGLTAQPGDETSCSSSGHDPLTEHTKNRPHTCLRKLLPGRTLPLRVSLLTTGFFRCLRQPTSCPARHLRRRLQHNAPPVRRRTMTEWIGPSQRVLVKYPLFKTAVARIQACSDSYGTTAEPDCCPIAGESGSGVYHFPPELEQLALGPLLRLIRFVGLIGEKDRLRRKQSSFPRTDLVTAIQAGQTATAALRDWPRPLREALRRMLPPGTDNPAALKFSQIFGNFYRTCFVSFPAANSDSFTTPSRSS